MTRSQAEARGLKVESEDITYKLIEPIDPTTGNKGPAVQMQPDPGWSFNPGESYWGNLGETLAERAERWHPRIAKQLLTDNMMADEFGLYLKRPKDIYPALRLGEEVAQTVGASSPVAVLREEELLPLLASGIGASDLAKLPTMDITKASDGRLELSGQGIKAVFVVIEGRLVLTEMENM